MTSDTQNKLKSAIYVDTQNLGGSTVAEKAEVIKRALLQWPSDQPPLSRIRAYIEPSQENYWKDSLNKSTQWKEGAYNISIPGLEIETPPIQRYGKYAAKNALDITLVLDTLSDIMLKSVHFAAVISNDSDFAALYFKLQDLVEQGSLQPSAEINGIPLLFFIHEGSGVSKEFKEDLKQNVVQIEERPVTSITGTQTASSANTVPNIVRPLPSLLSKFNPEQIIGAIANGIGYQDFQNTVHAYEFNSQRVHRSIMGGCLTEEARETEEMKMSIPDFGRWFFQTLWPEMEKHGATMFNNTSPEWHKYRLPQEVRAKIAELRPQ